MTILNGDCRILMLAHGLLDLILADTPYGDTTLAWDRRVDGWLPLACAALKLSGSLWMFGSLRSFMATADRRYLGCEIDVGMVELAPARIASVLSFTEGAQP